MAKKKIDKGNAITAGVVVILCIIFVVLFVYGLDKVLSMEGSYPPDNLVEGASKAPETSEEAVEFLARTYKDATEEKPKITRSDTFSVDSDSITCGSSEEVMDTLEYLRKPFENCLEDGFEGFETDFDEEAPEDIMAPDFDAADCISYDYYRCGICGDTSDTPSDSCDECGAETALVPVSAPVRVDYIYYECPSCGETSKVYLDCCELCGGTEPYVEKYRDEYEITLALSESAIEKCFDPLTDDEILALIGDELDGYVNLGKFDIQYDRILVVYKVDRLTDKLTYLEYRKVMNVTADVEFAGELSSLGNTGIAFTITEKNKFDFTWPGLELNNHEMDIEPGSTDNLLATLTCSDPTVMTVTWTSSDESVLTVDGEGYIKTGKEAGTATVTASFEFNGVTYSDSCVVNVRYSVESIKLNKSKLNLDVGSTYQLTSKTSPSDATVQTVTWYTDDDCIATVDENGIVTGVKPGQVTVYALSDDGYFRSSCEVTVK